MSEIAKHAARTIAMRIDNLLADCNCAGGLKRQFEEYALLEIQSALLSAQRPYVEWIQKYGRHSAYCEAWRHAPTERMEDADWEACTCGLTGLSKLRDELRKQVGVTYDDTAI